MHSNPYDKRPTIVIAPVMVLFDGDCNLCNAAVRFIMANDRDGCLHFAPLQSAAGAATLAPFSRDPACAASIVVIDADGLHEGSGAALRVARRLRRPWRWLALLEAIPARVRDPVYEWIARNRYRWFGRRTMCAPPSDARRAFAADDAGSSES